MVNKASFGIHGTLDRLIQSIPYLLQCEQSSAWPVQLEDKYVTVIYKQFELVYLQPIEVQSED